VWENKNKTKQNKTKQKTKKKTMPVYPGSQQAQQKLNFFSQTLQVGRTFFMLKVARQRKKEEDDPNLKRQHTCTNIFFSFQN
jgi:hypothetical protein